MKDLQKCSTKIYMVTLLSEVPLLNMSQNQTEMLKSENSYAQHVQINCFFSFILYHIL